ncbi:MAG: BMC domain-containing protein [Acidimicrobiales bacterium]
MSDTADHLSPAIGLLEFDSIVAGIIAGDAMAKSSPVSSLYAGTVHPGRYLVLVGGDTASVEIALESAAGDHVLDSMMLAAVHPAVVSAIATPKVAASVDGDALGMVEASHTATAIIAADAGMKAAQVSLVCLRLADDLGGKAYCLFTGAVADVEAAVEQSVAATGHRGKLTGSGVISQLHQEMRDNLAADLRFNHHLQRGTGTS